MTSINKYTSDLVFCGDKEKLRFAFDLDTQTRRKCLLKAICLHVISLVNRRLLNCKIMRIYSSSIKTKTLIQLDQLHGRRSESFLCNVTEIFYSS
ncbi:hypothetical protein GDO81_003522 [Engystomops pustulosus]|uniref:Uncharacterized protein n=1 Tax=Engystomops pustulosus TaxID=76066 RepID=A0AAV7A1S0_ENGPU|nr:hypothetical protein GDO81_003522 [Engystomops pustulosus]